MNPRILLICTSLVLATAAGAAAQGPYGSQGKVPDGVAILPPPPLPGSPASQADRRIFMATRKLRGTPRWRIATQDVTNDPLDRYACALGIHLTPTSAPAIARLLDRAGTGELVDPVKSHYQEPRPFLGNGEPICEARTAHLAANGDYPSGHAANGWLEALILAELAPERATAILTRGREYGESRVVCGSHSLSAVEASWMAAAAAFAVLNADPGFRHDLDAASRELAAVRTAAPKPDPGNCAVEQTTLAARPW